MVQIRGLAAPKRCILRALGCGTAMAQINSLVEREPFLPGKYEAYIRFDVVYFDADLLGLWTKSCGRQS
jgi:hypothetical protein